MNVREIRGTDLQPLLKLYTQLHDNSMPTMSSSLSDIWCDILDDKFHHIIVAVEEEKIVSSCVLIVVPNLTHAQRPYAFIENVITDEQHRKRGFASACLEYAKQIAKLSNCYKIMLMTGSKKESTLNFYKRAGYNAEDKTAFIQWL